MKEAYEIAYKEKIIPEAFHGTHIDNALNIIKEGFRIQDDRQDAYLGPGVYFYESCMDYAMEWATNNCGLNKPDIGIILACVKLGKCLDFHNSEHIKYLQLVWQELEKKGIKPITDAVVINFYATHFDNIDTVYATHIPGQKKKIFHGSRFWQSQKIIICVRNLGSILNIDIAFNGRKCHD